MEREKLLKLKQVFIKINDLIDEILIYDAKERNNALTKEEDEYYKSLVGRFFYEFIVANKVIE